MDAERFFSELWARYVAMAPRAQVVHDSIERRFGPIANDHVAFRTFDRAGYRISDLEPAFLELGYTRAERYEFPDKHLEAYGYLPPDDALPLIFFSQLLCDELSPASRAIVEELLDAASPLATDPQEKLRCGRPWPMPSSEAYSALEAESAYAAWLSVWGLCANHFTVAVHRLAGAVSLEAVVAHLRAEGFALNSVGGVIKGNPQQLLEQASTMADVVDVALAGAQIRSVGSCYYEFARRYPDSSGQLYRGFVAASASNIFESTTVPEAPERRASGSQKEALDG